MSKNKVLEDLLIKLNDQREQVTKSLIKLDFDKGSSVSKQQCLENLIMNIDNRIDLLISYFEPVQDESEFYEPELYNEASR